MIRLRYLPLLLIILFTLGYNNLFGQQEPKQIQAFRTENHIKIDGELSEPDWANAQSANDFIQLEPYPGEPASQPTDVRLLYDDAALYVGAMMYDSDPDSILREFSVRDDVNNADNFGIYIDPFNDAITSFGFGVTASGVQVDVKLVGDHDDESWDGVWHSDQG